MHISFKLFRLVSTTWSFIPIACLLFCLLSRFTIKDSDDELTFKSILKGNPKRV